MKHVQQRLDVSGRRACRVVGQARSSQRYAAARPERDRALVQEMRARAAKHPRYGYRRVHALLVREGWRVNAKRVQRLWRTEGLKVHGSQHKRRRLGTSAHGCERQKAESRKLRGH